MSDATIGNTIDNHVGDLEVVLSDLLGVPINTNIAAALFEVVAAGLKKIILQDAAGDPAAIGEILLNGTDLKFHDGTIVKTINTGLIPVKVWIPAAGVDGTSASPIFDLPSSNAPVATAYGTTPNKFGALDFADGVSALNCQFSLMLPSDWVATGGIDINFIWFSATADATKNVVWTCATKSIADAEDVIAPTFNAAQTVVDANKATANQRNIATITGVTTTGFAAGELATFRVGRDPTSGSDDLVATAMLIGCEVTYRRLIP